LWSIGFSSDNVRRILAASRAPSPSSGSSPLNTPAACSFPLLSQPSRPPVQQGARSFLVTEYKYLAVFVVGVGAFLVGVLEGQDNAPAGYTEKGGWQTLICFIVGAVLSASAGWAGMQVATSTNVKTMEAAKQSLNAGLKVAFAGGAVMGFTVTGLGILGITILMLIFAYAGDNGDFQNMKDAARYLTGFGFGASSIALFARVAGGIYTKAADVGADLVGKVESDIPEDDPRNPATIADNVGDNVGDVAGMGADLFESFVGSIIAAATLASNSNEIAYPFWIAGAGIICAAIGFFFVKTKEDATQNELLHSIHLGMNIASVLVVGAAAGITYGLLDKDMPYQNDYPWKVFGCILIGLAVGILIGMATEYFTSYGFNPTVSIATAGSMGGAATVIIQGLGVGMLSTLPPVFLIVVAIISCAELAGVYGISMAAVGMLSTLGVTLATDAYGPVADNAGGIAEMTEDCPEEVRDRTDRLDALGNTTAATGKGFAIGSAVLTALALLVSYTKSIKASGIAKIAEGYGAAVYPNLILDVTNPLVLAGVIFGAMLPYLFGALTMLSVRKAAGSIIVEVQRQFREIDGLLAGKAGVKCETEKCVSLCTAASVREMILPGAIAVLSPICIGFLIGAEALGGMLAGAISSGFMLAVMMSNAGGAWDNAKKYIENEKAFGGKKSDTHKACVVGDTVGDPFKDTSGPSLNILIKLMSIFSLVLAPVFSVEWDTWWVGLIISIVTVGICYLAYWYAWVYTKDPLVEALAKKAEEGKQ